MYSYPVYFSIVTMYISAYMLLIMNCYPNGTLCSVTLYISAYILLIMNCYLKGTLCSVTPYISVYILLIMNCYPNDTILYTILTCPFQHTHNQFYNYLISSRIHDGSLFTTHTVLSQLCLLRRIHRKCRVNLNEMGNKLFEGTVNIG